MKLEIQKILEHGLTSCNAEISSDGSKYEAKIISPDFNELSTVKRHQLVYSLLNEHITSGEIHALTIKAFTPNEV